jgi:uncharacterized protein YjiS (DUF1127 family)
MLCRQTGIDRIGSARNINKDRGAQMPEPSVSSAGRRLETAAQGTRLSEKNSSFPAAIVHTMTVWLDRRRRRRELQDLAERNDRLLADVGLTREEALREASKPCWQR